MKKIIKQQLYVCTSITIVLLMVFSSCQKDEETGGGGGSTDCTSFKITNYKYIETEDLHQAGINEMGTSYKLADWNDLKKISDIEGWIKCMGFSDDQTFLVTKSGDGFYSGGTRHYFVHYFADGDVPGNWLVHDEIGNKLFLGSWYDLNMNLLAIKGTSPPPPNDCNGLDITTNKYSETENLNQAVINEMGTSYQIADWNDLKSINNIQDWINCMGFSEDQTFMLKKNGNYFYSGNRQYYVHYSSDGIPYSGYLVHDQIGGLYLGSWFDLNMQILGKK